MFWETVSNGLRVLLYWQTYVAGLEYLALSMIPRGIVGLLMQRQGRILPRIGWLSLFLLPSLQIVGLIVFVFTLAPIILGLSSSAAWTLPFLVLEAEPVLALKLVGGLLLIAFAFSFVPIVGRLQPLQTFVLAAMALVLVVGLTKDASVHVEAWPGFWFTVGLSVIGITLSFVGYLLCAIIGTALQPLLGELAYAVLYPIAAVLGFLPLFIYGAYIGHQLKLP